MTTNTDSMTFNELMNEWELSNMQGDRELLAKIYSELVKRRGARNNTGTWVAPNEQR